MPENKIIQLVVGFIHTNCWIYSYSENSEDRFNQCAIIDPGEDADEIISAVKENSLTPKYILLTHGHFDHIIALPKLLTAFNPKPQIAIHHLDSRFLGPGSYEIHRICIVDAMGGKEDKGIMASLPRTLPPEDVCIGEGSEIGPFTVIHTPGHTPGSVCFWDKRSGNLFTGDTLFKNGFGRTDIPGGDPKQIYLSLKRLFELDPNTKVFPGHGEATTIGREKR